MRRQLRCYDDAMPLRLFDATDAAAIRLRLLPLIMPRLLMPARAPAL